MCSRSHVVVVVVLVLARQGMKTRGSVSLDQSTCTRREWSEVNIQGVLQRFGIHQGVNGEIKVVSVTLWLTDLWTWFLTVLSSR